MDDSLLDTDASLYAVGGVLNQFQGDSSSYRLCQPKPSPFSAMVLYNTPGHAGGGCHVHAFPVVSSVSSVHPLYRSQLSPVAAEISQWLWDVGPLVHVVGPVSVTYEYGSGDSTRKCGRYV